MLDPADPNRGTSWRAVRWQPGVAAALDADIADALDGMVTGTRGRAILDAAARLRALRAGEAAETGGLLDDVDEVVTTFPLPLGVGSRPACSPTAMTMPTP